MRKAKITRNYRVVPSASSPSPKDSSGAGVPAPLEPMLRLDQVLALLGCSRSTLYAGIDEGRYPAPKKDGRISLWPTASIRNWMADPNNFESFVAAKTAAPRGLRSSAVFASSIEQILKFEKSLETVVLLLMLHNYRSYCAVKKPSEYDVKAAAAVEARMAELAAGAPGNIPLLKRWRPAARKRA